MARGQEYVLCDAGSTLRTRVAAGKKVHDTWCKRSSRWDRMGQDGTKQQACIFPHLEPLFFRETYFFSFCISPPPISSHCGKKRRRCGGGQKMSSPGGPSTTLSTSTRFVQALWRSFSVSSLYTTWYRVVSVVNSSICLSINNVHRFQMIFNCSCHR